VKDAARDRSGLFVSFEGGEGSGKSTQARALEKHLVARGLPVALTREPGGTPLGEEVRRILLDRANAGMTPEAELFLYLASRAEHVARVIEPRLIQGEIVISDRFGDASVAYQGGGRRLGIDFVRALNAKAVRGVKPDITFLLDLDPEEGLRRLARKVGEGGCDRIESEALTFHERVREAYLRAAESEPARFVVIDARRSEGEIASLIAGRVDELTREIPRERRTWHDE
jgi:dTMP kinase